MCGYWHPASWASFISFCFIFYTYVLKKKLCLQGGLAMTFLSRPIRVQLIIIIIIINSISINLSISISISIIIIIIVIVIVIVIAGAGQKTPEVFVSGSSNKKWRHIRFKVGRAARFTKRKNGVSIWQDFLLFANHKVRFLSNWG